jgi:Lon protease-like protein
MTMSEDLDLDALRHFDGVSRLFPLPNFVLFPHVVKPLHIFEPRYREMTADALKSDRLIALVQLKPGWDEDYEGTPPVYDMACLAHIVNDQRLPDGKYNLLVRGLCRLQLLEEVVNLKLYRSARGKIVCDPVHEDNAVTRLEMAKAAVPWIQAAGPILTQFQQVLQTKLPLGVLCDILAFTLPLPVEIKQELLAEIDIPRRAECLLHALRTNPPELLPRPRPIRPGKFPPDFSVN